MRLQEPARAELDDRRDHDGPGVAIPPREAGEGDRVAVEGARLAEISATLRGRRAPSTAFGGPLPRFAGRNFPPGVPLIP